MIGPAVFLQRPVLHADLIGAVRAGYEDLAVCYRDDILARRSGHGQRPVLPQVKYV